MSYPPRRSASGGVLCEYSGGMLPVVSRRRPVLLAASAAAHAAVWRWPPSPSSPPGAPVGLCRQTAKPAPCDLVVHTGVEPRRVASPWSLYPTLFGRVLLERIRCGKSLPAPHPAFLGRAQRDGELSESVGECGSGTGRNRQRSLRAVTGRAKNRHKYRLQFPLLIQCPIFWPLYFFTFMPCVRQSERIWADIRRESCQSH